MQVPLFILGERGERGMLYSISSKFKQKKEQSLCKFTGHKLPVIQVLYPLWCLGCNASNESNSKRLGCVFVFLPFVLYANFVPVKSD